MPQGFNPYIQAILQMLQRSLFPPPTAPSSGAPRPPAIGPTLSRPRPTLGQDLRLGPGTPPTPTQGLLGPTSIGPNWNPVGFDPSFLRGIPRIPRSPAAEEPPAGPSNPLTDEFRLPFGMPQIPELTRPAPAPGPSPSETPAPTGQQTALTRYLTGETSYEGLIDELFPISASEIDAIQRGDREDVQPPPNVLAALQAAIGGGDILGDSVSLGRPPTAARAGSLPIGGPDPELSEPSAGLGPKPPKPPGFMDYFLAGLVESITPAIVSFAAQRFDAPEVAQAYAQDQAMRLQEVRFQMEQEAARAQAARDAHTAAIQQANLELNLATSRRQILSSARELQSEAAGGRLRDPRVYANSIQGLAMEYGVVGGDPLDFIASHPLPQWDLLEQMRKDALERFSESGGNINAFVNAENVRNPITGEMITAAEALTLLGGIEDDGTVVVPWTALGNLGLPEVTTRDAAGRETSARLPLESVIGETFTREPLPDKPEFDSETFHDPYSGQAFTVRTNRLTGEVTVVPAYQGTPEGILNPANLATLIGSLEQTDVYRLAWDLILQRVGGTPTAREVMMVIQRPDDPAVFDEIRRLRGSGGR